MIGRKLRDLGDILTGKKKAKRLKNFCKICAKYMVSVH